jgi:hypothetical protein
MTICDLPGVINTSLHLATTPNIKAGFKVSGIYPYNRHVLTEEKRLPSYVTDTPTPPTNTAASNGKGMPLDESTRSNINTDVMFTPILG